MALDIDTVFRDHVVKGDIHSGANEPDKAEIRALLKTLTGAATAPAVVKATKAALDLVTPSNESHGGIVLNDPDPTKNGYYYRDSAVWVKGRGFPDTFAAATFSGNGTAQTMSVDPGINPADILVYFGAVTVENTGAFTLGGIDVVNASGAALSAGEWTGVVLFFLNSDGEYQLINDAGAAAAAAASAASADADRIAAEAAATAAEAALSSIVTTSFSTKAVAETYAPTVGPLYIRLEGYTAAGDGGGALYKKVASEPSHTGKFSITLDDAVTVVWYEIAESVIDPMMLGGVGFVGTRAAWDAIVLAGTYTDDYTALQATLDILSARAGGGEMRVSRFHVANTPLVVPYGVSIVGDSKFTCGIFKDSTTTKTVTYYDTAATTQVTIYPGALPTAANAVLILGAAFGNGRWVGEIKGVTIGGTYATPGTWDSQKVEFGILSIGSISDFVIDDNNVDDCEYGMLIPTPFVGQITNNRVTACLSGFGIGNCTTLTMHGNYANNCRDYGYAMRAGKYSSFFANACDYLNDNTRHLDRTRECSAYIFNSCIGISVFNNGQEGTLGNSFLLEALRYCSITDNLSLRIGSDYSGAEEIAFIKATTALIGCTITGNNAYDESPSGLTFGSANAANHHNIYLTPGILLNDTTFHNNVVRAVFSGTDGEAGWGNNVGQEALLVKRGGLFVGADRVSTYQSLIKGMGNTSATYAQVVQNSDGTSIVMLRDDGSVRFPSISTTGAAGNAFLDASNFLFRSTSALKYKDVVGPISDEVVDKVLAIVGFLYTAKDAEDQRLYIGLAADHFHDAGLTEFVHYDADGSVGGLMYERIVAVLMQEARSVRARLARLEARN